MSEDYYVYTKAKPVEVVDGDTMDFDIDLGFYIRAMIRVRLNNVDTPEIYRPDSEAERRLGEKASQFVKDTLFNYDEVKLYVYEEGYYGRWIADVILPNEKVLNKMLKENKLLKEHVKET